MRGWFHRLPREVRYPSAFRPAAISVCERPAIASRIMRSTTAVFLLGASGDVPMALDLDQDGVGRVGLDELFEVGDGLVGLVGADEVVDGLPQLHRHERLRDAVLARHVH